MRMTSVWALSVMGLALVGGVPACAQNVLADATVSLAPADQQALAAAITADKAGDFKQVRRILAPLAENGNQAAKMGGDQAAKGAESDQADFERPVPLFAGGAQNEKTFCGALLEAFLGAHSVKTAARQKSRAPISPVHTGRRRERC